MFKIGIYKKQLNLIVILLVFLSIGSIANAVDWAADVLFTPANAAPAIKPIDTRISVNDGITQVDEGGISFKGANGKVIMMPREMRGYEELEGFYKNDTLRVYVNDAPKADYTMKLADDFIEIYDGPRLVGTLTYKTSLGRMIMKDNE